MNGMTSSWDYSVCKWAGCYSAPVLVFTYIYWGFKYIVAKPFIYLSIYLSI